MPAIFCDTCFYFRNDGTREQEVLGSIDPNGRLFVKRNYKNSQEKFTIIGGNSLLTLYCSSCNFAVDVKISPQVQQITYHEHA